jgi:hypothetical protein
MRLENASCTASGSSTVLVMTIVASGSNSTTVLVLLVEP